MLKRRKVSFIRILIIKKFLVPIESEEVVNSSLDSFIHLFKRGLAILLQQTMYFSNIYSEYIQKTHLIFNPMHGVT